MGCNITRIKQTVDSTRAVCPTSPLSGQAASSSLQRLLMLTACHSGAAFGHSTATAVELQPGTAEQQTPRNARSHDFCFHQHHRDIAETASTMNPIEHPRSATTLTYKKWAMWIGRIVLVPVFTAVVQGLPLASTASSRRGRSAAQEETLVPLVARSISQNILSGSLSSSSSTLHWSLTVSSEPLSSIGCSLGENRMARSDS
jgi:hypothetical protein